MKHSSILLAFLLTACSALTPEQLSELKKERQRCGGRSMLGSEVYCNGEQPMPIPGNRGLRWSDAKDAPGGD